MKQFDVRSSFLATGMAIECNPDLARAAVEDGHEMVGHGYRWITYQGVSVDQEAEYIAKCVESIRAITGKRAIGWLSGWAGGANTRRLLLQEGGFLHDRDCLNDELPYWSEVVGRQHLCVPYLFETNELRSGVGGDWVNGDDFFVYMRDAFHVLYA